MAELYAYHYAYVDPDTNMCIEVCTGTYEDNAENMIPIPVYDEDYLMKYYNRENGQWYEDAEFTIPWQSSLI